MNKLFGLFLLALAFIPGGAEAATCFWIGGTGSWNNSNTASWASASGGTASTCAATSGPINGIPGPSDVATFDASSGAGTATINSPNGAGSLTVQTINLTNYTGTLDNSANNNTVTLAAGNGVQGTAGAFTLNFGAATWNISGGGSALFSLHNGATVSAASSTINLVNTGTGVNINTANKTYGVFTISMTNAAGGQVGNANNGATFATLTLGATAGNFTYLTGNVTITSAFNISGTSSKQILLTNTGGATLTLTGATITATWAGFHRITATGATISASNSFDLGGNSGVTATPPSGGTGGGRIIGG